MSCVHAEIWEVTLESEAITMHDDLERQVETERKSEPWDRLVADAGPCDHIVQLYQDEDFLSRAVCRFAGGALANGEATTRVQPPPHGTAFPPGLGPGAVNVKAAQERGQLR